MVWYHLVFSDNKKAVGYAWNLLGFIAKLAQGVRSRSPLFFFLVLILGICTTSLACVCRLVFYPCPEFTDFEFLDRDGSKLKVIPEEEDKRRFLFWELLNLDCRLVCSLKL